MVLNTNMSTFFICTHCRCFNLLLSHRNFWILSIYLILPSLIGHGQFDLDSSSKTKTLKCMHYQCLSQFWDLSPAVNSVLFIQFCCSQLRTGLSQFRLISIVICLFRYSTKWIDKKATEQYWIDYKRNDWTELNMPQ